MFNDLLSMFPGGRNFAVSGCLHLPLAFAAPRCHRRVMARPPSRKSGGVAGGSLVALSILAGVIVGTLYGQPSIGFLTGLGIGVLLYLLVWLLGRRG